MAISVRGEQKRGKRKSSQVTKVVFKETSFVLNSTPSLSEFLQPSKVQSIVEFQVTKVVIKIFVLNSTLSLSAFLQHSKEKLILQFQVDVALANKDYSIQLTHPFDLE